MYALVEDMSKIYARPLPKVYAIFLFAIEYSAKAQHTTTGARAGGGGGGRQWTGIFFDQIRVVRRGIRHGFLQEIGMWPAHGMPNCMVPGCCPLPYILVRQQLFEVP